MLVGARHQETVEAFPLKPFAQPSDALAADEGSLVGIKGLEHLDRASRMHFP